MKTETLKALKKSIAHWRRMENGSNECPSSKSCALCGLFNTEKHKWLDRCRGCPVKNKTGEQLCAGTPYHKAHDAYHHARESEFKLAAKDERKFLESLLPKGKR